MTETTNAASTPEQPQPQGRTYSSDLEGVRAASEELRRKRGQAEADGEADSYIGNGADDVQRPATEEVPLSAKEGAQEVAEWRRQREAKREAFERAVFGPEASEQEAAKFDAISSTESFAQELGNQIAEHDKGVAAAQQQQPQAPAPAPAPLSHVERELVNYIDSQVAQGRQQIINEIIERFPEAADQHQLNELQKNWPERYAEIAAAYQHGEQALGLVQKAAQLEAVKVQNGLNQQYATWANQQDQIFASRHPELADAKVRAEVFEGVMGYLKELGLSDADIQASWAGTGPVNLRHAAAQETLLRAARFSMAKKSLATSPRPKNIPRVQKPGARGDVEPRNRFADLEKNFERTGSARDAAKLIAARRTAARKGR